jgi:pyruvate/2-oxoglutarate dehydrogenase complex dihydrolipoamide acyltransferase (E2) component
MMSMMSKHSRRYRLLPYSRTRQAAQDLEIIQRKHLIHGLAEVDITGPRARLAAYQERTGEEISFTAWVVTCVARAVREQPTVQAYRQGRSHLLVFDDVDVTVFIERALPQGRSEVTFHVVRRADTKSLLAIHQELRDAQRPSGQSSSGLPVVQIYEALPRFARRMLIRLAKRFPALWTQIGGTVAVTAVGMFAKDLGGWGIPQTWNTLDVTVGSTARKPGIFAGQIGVREYLSITASFDHDVVDGAPAARFCRRLAELLEEGYGLDTLTGAIETPAGMSGPC